MLTARGKIFHVMFLIKFKKHIILALRFHRFKSGHSERSGRFCFIEATNLYIGCKKDNSMAKVPKNNGKPWSQADISSIRTLAGRNTPIGLIANKLGRTEESIRSKAINEGISLKPSTQSVNKR